MYLCYTNKSLKRVMRYSRVQVRRAKRGVILLLLIPMVARSAAPPPKAAALLLLLRTVIARPLGGRPANKIARGEHFAATADHAE